MMFAAQERRRWREELIGRTPADGLVGGVGAIAGESCVAMSYDYTVLAGTQRMQPSEEGPRRGRGISMASYFEIDDVIDPADTRRWIATLFDEGAPHWSQQPGKRRPFVDTY